MKYLIVPQIYTIIAFGASIFWWQFLSPIPLVATMEGMPLYLIHPFFALELILNSSTATIWIVAMMVSLHNLRKQRITITKSMVQHWFMISLAFATVIVAVSGAIFYSEIIYLEEYPDGLRGLRALSPPNPFGTVHSLGVLFCEAAWIIDGLLKSMKHLRTRNIKVAFLKDEEDSKHVLFCLA